ncbi:pimeloyl-ACP methyl ester carboxylesterase [Microbacterium marinum]|uniref:Pimeloyl-ACP methyl ester carboxylesterase n=1 Tax=Microbacterium marinum TaxID=421115 RepID=A0A7W7FM70_9MICO|nr:alpha/beta fold hydrolase [Microbacterium marinum]MBB4668094.1 pimeloyl-ACP methyl ester carboxylesterase [Microbacterium marinum]
MRLDLPEVPDHVVHASVDRPGAGRPVLLWHHGSPQTGAVLPPVQAAADAAGLDVVSVARPAYGGAARSLGRTVRDVAVGLARVLEALDLRDVVSVGASGGGPHALAVAAVSPRRVAGVVTLASIAPYRPGDDAWFEGMADPSGLRAAIDGLGARTAHVEVDEFDPTSFVEADYRALETTWASLGTDVAASDQWGPDGLVDDDLAFTRPWGFDLAEVEVPVIVVQGGLDRVIPPAHATAIAEALPHALLQRIPDAGHIAVLDHLPAALAALADLRR